MRQHPLGVALGFGCGSALLLIGYMIRGGTDLGMTAFLFLSGIVALFVTTAVLIIVWLLELARHRSQVPARVRVVRRSRAESQL